MTVAELIRQLERIPDKSIDVYVNDEHFDDLRPVERTGEDRNLPGVQNKVVIFYRPE